MTSFRGKVFSGMEEAGYYLSLDPYQDRIEEVAGFRPFPGTLNLRVDPSDVRKLKASLEPEVIEQVEYGNEEYSRLEVYPVEIEGVEAAFLDIEITDYGDDVMEIVARERLRDKLDLEDGDEAGIEY